MKKRKEEWQEYKNSEEVALLVKGGDGGGQEIHGAFLAYKLLEKVIFHSGSMLHVDIEFAHYGNSAFDMLLASTPSFKGGASKDWEGMKMVQNFVQKSSTRRLIILQEGSGDRPHRTNSDG